MRKFLGKKIFVQIFAQLFAKKFGPTNLCANIFANICANFWRKNICAIICGKICTKIAQIFYGSYLVLGQDKEKMPIAEENKSKNGRLFGLVMARGRCWTGTWKRALEITGFLVDQGIKDLNFVRIFCQNDIISETWALPITVLFAVFTYAIVAAVFYNNDG